MTVFDVATVFNIASMLLNVTKTHVHSRILNNKDVNKDVYI